MRSQDQAPRGGLRLPFRITLSRFRGFKGRPSASIAIVAEMCQSRAQHRHRTAQHASEPRQNRTALHQAATSACFLPSRLSSRSSTARGRPGKPRSHRSKGIRGMRVWGARPDSRHPPINNSETSSSAIRRSAFLRQPPFRLPSPAVVPPFDAWTAVRQPGLRQLGLRPPRPPPSSAPAATPAFAICRSAFLRQPPFRLPSPAAVPPFDAWTATALHPDRRASHPPPSPICTK